MHRKGSQPQDLVLNLAQDTNTLPKVKKDWNMHLRGSQPQDSVLNLAKDINTLSKRSFPKGGKLAALLARKGANFCSSGETAFLLAKRILIALHRASADSLLGRMSANAPARDLVDATER